MTYSPPDVIVNQAVQTTNVGTTAPQLPVVVVGPAVQIVYRGDAGLYTSGDAFSATLPDLNPGANVTDPTTVKIYLQAQSLAGANLGLFALSSPDAELDGTGTLVLLTATFALSYSLISSNNNNVDDTTDNVYSTGTPAGVSFTDNGLDFLSLGASIGDTDVVINSPASMVGAYRIYQMIGAGAGVNQVYVEQMLDPIAGTKVLVKSFNITVGGYAGVNGTAIILGSQTDVPDVGLVSPGGTLYTVGTANYPIAPYFAVPSPTSADQVTINLSAQASNVTAAWNALVAAAAVGNYLRIAGDATSGANGDFKIVGVNTTANTLTVIRPGQSGTGTVTASGGGGATFALLQVLRGSQDQNNAAGDTLEMVVGGVTVQYEVLNAQPTQITVTSTITGLTGATAVTCRRGVPFENSSASYDLVKRLTSGYTGEVLVSYEAPNPGLSVNGLLTIGGFDDITNQIGFSHPDNPLALGCDMVTRSGFTDGTRVFYALATTDDTIDAFQVALDTLSMVDVYHVIPLTQDPSILSLFKAHVDAQSQPLNKHERITYKNTALHTFDTVIPVVGNTWPDDGIIGTGSDLTRFDSASIDWSQVSPGDNILILASADPNAAVLETRRIFTITGTHANIIGNFSSNYGSNPQFFRIQTYPYTKDQQAAGWADEASSDGDTRVMFVRPDAIEIEYTDQTTGTPTTVSAIVPGYYLACAFAGLKASMAPQLPMTNVPIPGIKRLFDSNTFFTPAQLNTIAGGGNAIFVQDNINSAPYCRHQLMSDMTSLQTREYSVRTNLDFVAKYFRASFKPYIGNKNIDDELLNQLNGIGEAIIRSLVASKNLMPGSSFQGVMQNPDQPDSTIVGVGCKLPYPNNYMYITLYV